MAQFGNATDSVTKLRQAYLQSCELVGHLVTVEEEG